MLLSDVICLMCLDGLEVIRNLKSIAESHIVGTYEYISIYNFYEYFESRMIWIRQKKIFMKGLQMSFIILMNSQEKKIRLSAENLFFQFSVHQQ